ncbi:protein of unknown function [Methanoculleus bourgensis]|uniref:Uncharacterized protein n=1 Tax=Methanoculleus bourgensis TaxID=83986 RepID=A0A0X3BJE8_9EURY|nr:protein of unknown function [Methanoculleus bourgensis]
MIADGIADERAEGELAGRVTAPEPERGRGAFVLCYPASADPIRRALPAQPQALTVRVSIPGAGQSIHHDPGTSTSHKRRFAWQENPKPLIFSGR